LVDEVLFRVPYGNHGGNQQDANLGFLRRYLASIGAHRKEILSDLNYVLANPRLRRFFSSEAPKKKSNFFPPGGRGVGGWGGVGFVMGILILYFNVLFVEFCFAEWLQIMRTSIQRRRRKFQKQTNRNPSPKVNDSPTLFVIAYWGLFWYCFGVKAWHEVINDMHEELYN